MAGLIELACSILSICYYEDRLKKRKENLNKKGKQMKFYIINIISPAGSLIRLNYAPADYETQADIIADKIARNAEYGIENKYALTTEK